MAADTGVGQGLIASEDIADVRCRAGRQHGDSAALLWS